MDEIPRFKIKMICRLYCIDFVCVCVCVSSNLQMKESVEFSMKGIYSIMGLMLNEHNGSHHNDFIICE